MYYCKSRYYDPSICRWISIDDFSNLDLETASGLNLWCYCGNNPIINCDPNGQFFILTSLLISVAIGALAAALSEYIPDVLKNVNEDGFQWSDFNTFSKENIRKYIGAGIGGAIGGLAGGFQFGLVGTMLISGFGQVVGDLIGGQINSFGDAAKSFAVAAFFSGVSYGVTSFVSKGISKLQFKNKIIKNATTSKAINNNIKKLTGSYQKALEGVKYKRTFGNIVDKYIIQQLGYTNINMAITESIGGILSILLSSGGL